jgi:leader peptidase (prepilin peptidase) / N-methyltransferase
MSVRRLSLRSRFRGSTVTFEDFTIGVAAIATAVASMIVVPGLRGVAGAGLACLMIGIAAVDARRFIIPDELSAAALALGLVHAAIQYPDGIGGALAIAALRGGIMALAFFGLWAAYRRLRGRDGIGLGDVKLAGVAGVWLDWPSIPIAVEIAALAALAVCLVRWLALGRTISATTRLPFGLFLAPAIWIAWLGETMLPQIPSVLGLE